MSSTTVLRHHASELSFVSADDLTGIVTFSAASKSKPGTLNHVSLDTATGAVLCDCKGAECGRACWHQDWVSAAWSNHEARRLARAMTTGQLLKAGTKAAHLCKVYRARIWRCVPRDQEMLVACRCEYRERAALAEAPQEAA